MQSSAAVLQAERGISRGADVRGNDPLSTSAHGIIETMRTRRLTFALFAAAILFSMVREWSAPVACIRTILIR